MCCKQFKKGNSNSFARRIKKSNITNETVLDSNLISSLLEDYESMSAKTAQTLFIILIEELNIPIQKTEFKRIIGNYFSKNQTISKEMFTKTLKTLLHSIFILF